jgi:hypothetical protein
MHFTRDEIKNDLLENWEQISSHAYPEDLLQEFSDGYVPIYYHEILKDWTEMPNDYTDRWQEIGSSPEDGIFKLMGWDLWFYYQELTVEIYNEIKDAKEMEEN